MIQIRDAVSQDARTKVVPTEEQPPPWWQRGIRGLSTPPEEAYRALVSSMSFRNDEHLSSLSDTFNNAGLGRDRFTTVVIECPVQAELNWSLTHSEAERIRAGVWLNPHEKLEALVEQHPRAKQILEKNQAAIGAIKAQLDK